MEYLIMLAVFAGKKYLMIHEWIAQNRKFNQLKQWMVIIGVYTQYTTDGLLDTIFCSCKRNLAKEFRMKDRIVLLYIKSSSRYTIWVEKPNRFWHSIWWFDCWISVQLTCADWWWHLTVAFRACGSGATFATLCPKWKCSQKSKRRRWPRNEIRWRDLNLLGRTLTPVLTSTVDRFMSKLIFPFLPHQNYLR